ncbi:polymorphic toxin-type HINT domain-containing protein [Kutzneria sp. NPDC052558]|uniref:polymorphic toxin-type HINT domain-containing protein n=1 Tax=Kutzneria sp. NPDC052558 TaxID=3364121 RepID=UPI0037C75E49
MIIAQTDRDFVDPTVKKLSTTLGKAAAGLALAAAALVTAAAPASAAPASADTSTLTTTYHHPFYDVTQSAFVDAVDLRVGDQLQTADGTTAEVTSIRAYHQTQTTYDLTIDGLHTYYVAAGLTPVLVHNCGLTITDDSWQHVTDFHRPGGVGVDDSKGVFNGKAKDVKSLLRETVQRGRPQQNTPDPVTGEARDGTIYEWDFGRTIGKLSVNDGGADATAIRVIVNPDGTLRTAHPI